MPRININRIFKRENCDFHPSSHSFKDFTFTSSTHFPRPPFLLCCLALPSLSPILWHRASHSNLKFLFSSVISSCLSKNSSAKRRKRSNSLQLSCEGQLDIGYFKGDAKTISFFYCLLLFHTVLR